MTERFRPCILVTPASLAHNETFVKMLEHNYEVVISTQNLSENLEPFEIIVLGNERFGEREFRAADNLKLIIRYGVTAHNVALDIAKKKGVKICHCPGASARSVAEYSLAAIFYLTKKLGQINGLSEANARGIMLGDIVGKRLGVCGFGVIGRMLSRMWLTLGHDVLVWNRSNVREECEHLGLTYTADVDEVFENCDVLSINLTLTTETTHFIDKRAINKMKRSPLLINTAQAMVVDSQSVLEALLSGKVSGFCADFIYEETDFKGLENVLFSPHISGRTRTTTETKIGMVKEIVDSFLNGAVDLPYQVGKCMYCIDAPNSLWR